MHFIKRWIARNRIKNRIAVAIKRDRKEFTVAKERISSNVERQTKLRVKKAAEALGLSESKFIEQAIKTDLDKLDIRLETKSAREQRDTFKAKYEESQANLTAAEANIAALQARGVFARLFNRPPKI